MRIITRHWNKKVLFASILCLGILLIVTISQSVPKATPLHRMFGAADASALRNVYNNNTKTMENHLDPSYSNSDLIPIIKDMQAAVPAVNTSVSGATRPKTNIVFLKVHKAASSTTQNIFLRYALVNQLNVIVSQTSTHLNEHDSYIDPRHIVPIANGSKFNILTHHIIFKKDHIRPFFPDDTVYIGIIREPFDRFVSSFYYYASAWNNTRLQGCIRDNPDPIKAYLTHPNRYDPPEALFSQINNRMSRDFGLDRSSVKKSRKNKDVIKEFVQKVEREFDLILIMEYFDTSMVLLKRFLNWRFEDIIYIKKNTAIKKRHSKSEYNKKLYNKWAPSEIALYDHFLGIFSNKVKTLGDEFLCEVAAFKKVRTLVEDFCGNATTEKKRQKILSVKGTKWSRPFKFSGRACYFLELDEIPFTNIIRQTQQVRFKQQGNNTR